MIVYWSEEDGVYVVDVPELPGCMAHGHTAAETVANTQEAIAFWLDTAKDLGRPIPEPKGRRLVYA